MKKYRVYSESASGGAKSVLYGYDEKVARAGYQTEVRWYEMLGYKKTEPPEEIVEYMNDEDVLEYTFLERGSDVAVVALKAWEVDE